MKPSDLVHGLKAGYHLSTFLAWFLTIGTYFLLWQFTRLSLSDIGRHNYIEHDASLAHQNTELEDEYAPCEVDDTLLAALCADAKTPGKGCARLSAVDIARARVRRETESPKLTPVHAEIARGEMAIALGVFGGKNGSKEGIPVEWLKEWIKDERLPQGWKFTHTQGMCETVRASADIRAAMKRMTQPYKKGELVGDDFTTDIDSTGTLSNRTSQFIKEMYKTTSPTSESEDERLGEKKVEMAEY
jgi:hypothetical protein